LRAAVGRDAAELTRGKGRNARRRSGGGVTPVEVIRQVERLQAQLDVARSAERDEAREGGVDRPVRGTFDGAILEVAERPRRGCGKRLAIQVVVERRRRLARRSGRRRSIDILRDLVRPLLQLPV